MSRPATKRMVILRRADHAHFIDDVERTTRSNGAQSFDAN